MLLMEPDRSPGNKRHVLKLDDEILRGYPRRQATSSWQSLLIIWLVLHYHKWCCKRGGVERPKESSTRDKESKKKKKTGCFSKKKKLKLRIFPRALFSLNENLSSSLFLSLAGVLGFGSSWSRDLEVTLSSLTNTGNAELPWIENNGCLEMNSTISYLDSRMFAIS